ncbi:Transferase [Parasponia andersonii]|uniref:Transferase n=1 Tax=Parasponia andersonii TaxID=3476 RepID=A0A2P5ACC5_PARAD|nr:Transferase [Parasponia andersonii]
MAKKTMNVEVTILSRENIKPCLPSLDHLKPYKLCLFDQLTPVTYSSGVMFYPITQPNLNLPKTLAHLKNSLSKALNLYYPFSGRTKKNLYVDDFAAGLLYLEARVNCRMSDSFKLRDTESLNRFIPFHPFRKETDTSGPQVAFQVNIFACSGIALVISLAHKSSDGSTVTFLLKIMGRGVRRLAGENHPAVYLRRRRDFPGEG